MKNWQIVFAAAASMAAASTAAAQTVSGLEPEAWNIRAGGHALVHFEREHANERERTAWAGDSVHWLFARNAGEQWNYDDLADFEPENGALRFAFTEPGTALIGLDLAPRIETVSADELRAFLENRVRVAPGGNRRLPGSDRAQRVRRWESTKLLVRVEGGEALPSSATAQSKSGQRAEIRPLARRIGGTATADVTVDADGLGYFTVTRPGVWVVEVHAARALPSEPDVDWEIYTASLRFEAPALEREEEK